MDETTRGAKRLVGAKRLGAKRLGGETTRGRNGLGAKRPGFIYFCMYNCSHSFLKQFLFVVLLYGASSVSP